jgi:creatinine deaminase
MVLSPILWHPGSESPIHGVSRALLQGTILLNRNGTLTFVPYIWQVKLMDSFMLAAIEQARAGLAEGGIPIGSVLVHGSKIIGRGHNRRVQSGSPVLHGEMDALENAGRQPARVYRECTIYTTLSPCSMCSGAILLYGIPRVVVGENQTFKGEEQYLRSRGVEVTILQNPDCISLMSEFIAARPELWNEDVGED